MTTCSLNDLIIRLQNVQNRYDGNLPVLMLLQDADSNKKATYSLHAIGVTGSELGATHIVISVDPCSKLEAIIDD